MTEHRRHRRLSYGGRGPGFARRTCGCGKWGFTTKKGAKATARRAHPGDHLAVYVCTDTDSGLWHYGHLKGAILGGALPRNVPRGTTR